MTTASPVPPGGLACGAVLHVQALTQAMSEPWEYHAGPPDMVRIAQKADEIGFLYIGVCDHCVVPDVSEGFGRANPGAAGNMRTTWYDTMTTLAFLAASTKRVRLLTYVLVPAYRHPLVVAKAAMTLDKLSAGRLILGLGAGHVEKEFEALGVDYSRRGRLLDEAIDALRTSFREEWTSFSGRTWRWSTLAQSPRPVQPQIPIWIGGSSDAALRRVAERGDGWLPLSTPRADMPRAIATIRKHAEEAERSTPIDVGFMAEWIYVGKPPGTSDPRRI
jgi:probable F420-dependent oxidoreductase